MQDFYLYRYIVNTVQCGLYIARVVSLSGVAESSVILGLYCEKHPCSMLYFLLILSLCDQKHAVVLTALFTWGRAELQIWLLWKRNIW